jgi:hypothetical protein
MAEKSSVTLPAKADENGKSVHEECYAYYKEAGVADHCDPERKPAFKGELLCVSHLTFAFVGDTAENHRLMQLAFEKHVKDIHKRNCSTS